MLVLHDIIPHGKPIPLIKSIQTDSKQMSDRGSLLVIVGRGVVWGKVRDDVSARVLYIAIWNSGQHSRILGFTISHY